MWTSLRSQFELDVIFWQQMGRSLKRFSTLWLIVRYGPKNGATYVCQDSLHDPNQTGHYSYMQSQMSTVWWVQEKGLKGPFLQNMIFSKIYCNFEVHFRFNCPPNRSQNGPKRMIDKSPKHPGDESPENEKCHPLPTFVIQSNHISVIPTCL